MTLSGSVNLLGFGVLIAGILLLIWTLYRAQVSAVGVALLISGFLLQIAAAFIK